MEEGIDVAGDARNKLTERDSHIWTLRMVVVLLVMVIMGLVLTIKSRQNIVDVQVPPDLSKGALLKPGEFLSANTFSFAHFIWTEMNTWPENGKSDFKRQLKEYECYMTRSFKKQMHAIYDEKLDKGELDRDREITIDIPYREKMVTNLGAGTFVTRLFMHMVEEVNGFELKNVRIEYPLRVVPDARKCNPFGQALDGFYEKPAIYNPQEVEFQ